MVESRWFRRAVAPIAAVGVVTLLATATLGAPGRDWRPEPCAGDPRVGDTASGTWYRIDPVIDAGARVGQHLVIGRAGEEGTRVLDLDAESFAAGPFHGTMLVGNDDGERSQLSLVDVARDCAWVIDVASDVVRTATIAPDGASVYEFRVERRTRADLGVWRRPLDGSAEPVPVLPPIAPDERFGPTWITDLAWTDDGESLAVQSCGEIACRVRIVDPAGGVPQLVDDPHLGDLVGLADGRLVMHGACRGLPCPLVSLDLSTGEAIVIDPAAGQAVLSRDAADRPVVVHEVGAGGDRLRVVGLDGRDPRALAGDPDGRRLVALPARSAGGAEHGRAWVLFGPDGRLPVDGSLPPLLRHVPDGRTVPLDEVSR